VAEDGRVARPAWYALGRGGWRDYVTLLHAPYTAWHLSYVVIGGCLVPVMDWERLGAAVAAFALAVGIGAHALDELHGRPLRTSIPDGVLMALAALSIGAACAIGIAGALAFDAWLMLLVPVGVFLVLAYNLELFGGRGRRRQGDEQRNERAHRPSPVSERRPHCASPVPRAGARAAGGGCRVR